MDVCGQGPQKYLGRCLQKPYPYSLVLGWNAKEVEMAGGAGPYFLGLMKLESKRQFTMDPFTTFSISPKITSLWLVELKSDKPCVDSFLWHRIIV